MNTTNKIEENAAEIVGDIEFGLYTFEDAITDLEKNGHKETADIVRKMYAESRK